MRTICFLSSMHTPYDKRVFDKEAISLRQAGFDVIHIAPAEGDVVIERGVKVIPYQRPRGLFDRVLQLPRLYRLAAQVDADFYHCNEVDSWLVGVCLKVLRGKRVVFDVHEHYPATFLAKRLPTVFRPVVANLIRLWLRLLIPLTDRIVFAQLSVRRDYPTARDKGIVVCNYAFRPDVTESEEPRSLESVTAVHLGLFNRSRGWPQLLEALARMKFQASSIHIIGEFNDGSQKAFEERGRELGVEARTHFEEWLPYEEAFKRLREADIGLILFQPGSQNHVHAMPHKMFDYMAAGLALLAPQFSVEVSAIVREVDCGLLVDPADPADIARALDELASNPDVRRRMGQNGREAILTRYNWENEAAKLIAMYRELEMELS